MCSWEWGCTGMSCPRFIPLNVYVKHETKESSIPPLCVSGLRLPCCSPHCPNSLLVTHDSSETAGTSVSLLPCSHTEVSSPASVAWVILCLVFGAWMSKGKSEFIGLALIYRLTETQLAAMTEDQHHSTWFLFCSDALWGFSHLTAAAGALVAQSFHSRVSALLLLLCCCILQVTARVTRGSLLCMWCRIVGKRDFFLEVNR